MSCCCSSLTAVAGAVAASSGGGGGGSGRPVPWLEPLNFDGSPVLQGDAVELVESVAYLVLSRYPSTGQVYLSPSSGGAMVATRGGRIIPRAGKRVIGVVADVSFYALQAISGVANFSGGNTSISLIAPGSLNGRWIYDFELAPAVYTQALGELSDIVFFDTGAVPILDSVRAIVVDAAADLSQIAPFIAAPPRSGNTEPGGTIELAVAAAGAEPVTYQWLHDDGAGPVPIVGATSRTYSVSASAASAGTYSVAVTSRGMTVTSTGAVRTVDYNAPVITTQPTAQTITEGGSITLSVAATGTSLTYQWRKDGAPISGATSSGYSLTNAPMSAAGSYDVIVTAGGSVSTTSSAVAVTVNTATVMLLHAEGANGSTTFTDSSASPIVWTPNLGAIISTAQARFGSSSIYLDGDAYLSSAAASRFAFGTGDFTVEAWVFIPAFNAYSLRVLLLNPGTSSNFTFEIDPGGGAMTFYGGSAGGQHTAWTVSTPAGQWLHVAWVRRAGILKAYAGGVAGVVKGGFSESNATNITASSANIGGPSGSGEPPCYIDEMRVKKGFGAYASAFTPPASAFAS